MGDVEGATRDRLANALEGVSHRSLNPSDLIGLSLGQGARERVSRFPRAGPTREHQAPGMALAT
jgi:hypothetical protein